MTPVRHGVKRMSLKPWALEVCRLALRPGITMTGVTFSFPSWSLSLSDGDLHYEQLRGLSERVCMHMDYLKVCFLLSKYRRSFRLFCSYCFFSLIAFGQRK